MTARRASGRGGAALTRAQRAARGETVLTVVLDAESAETLRKLEAGDPGEGARTRIVRRALRVLHSMGGSGERA